MERIRISRGSWDKDPMEKEGEEDIFVSCGLGPMERRDIITSRRRMMAEFMFLARAPLALANVAPCFGSYRSLRLNYAASSLLLVLDHFIYKHHILRDIRYLNGKEHQYGILRRAVHNNEGIDPNRFRNSARSNMN